MELKRKTKKIENLDRRKGEKGGSKSSSNWLKENGCFTICPSGREKRSENKFRTKQREERSKRKNTSMGKKEGSC